MSCDSNAVLLSLAGRLQGRSAAGPAEAEGEHQAGPVPARPHIPLFQEHDGWKWAGTSLRGAASLLEGQ